MLDLTKYPLTLQLLMNTDGTVTELIKLFASEEIRVVKASEKIIQENNGKILHRHIYLQGKTSKINWLYAESKIYLDYLSVNFYKDLIEKNIPIGSLWSKYKIETFKQILNQATLTSGGIKESGFEYGVNLLTRTYQVLNNSRIVMEITENFPIANFSNLTNFR